MRHKRYYKAMSLSSDEVLLSEETDEVCVRLRKNQVQALVELIEPQRWSTRWYGTDAGQETRDRFVDDITDRLLAWEQCDPEQPEDDGCFTINAFHPAITWHPNHPFLQPVEDPDYGVQVWRRGGGLFELSTPDDALLDILSFVLQPPLQALQNGLPSWTLHFSGTGEIDVHFVAQIQGGMAWVFPDGNPLAGAAVDLNWRDLTDFASTGVLFDFIEELFQGGQISDVIHTVNFDTPGNHTLTAWYFPVGELEPPFIGIGGGLRYIQLCGPSLELIEMPVAYTLECDNGQVKLLADDVPVSTIDLAACGISGPPGEPGQDGASPEMRIHDGWIQWRQDDDDPTWTNLVELETLEGAPGEQGPPGLPGEPGPSGPPGEDCDCDPPDYPFDDNENDLEGQWCSIAQYTVEFYNERFFAVLDDVDLGTDITSIVAGVISFVSLIHPAGLVVGLLVNLVRALTAAGTGAVRATIDPQFIEDATGELYCIIANNIGWSDELVTMPETAPFQQNIMIRQWYETLKIIHASNPAALLWVEGILMFDGNVYNQRAYIGSLSTSPDCAALYDCQPDQTGDCGWLFTENVTQNSGYDTAWLIQYVTPHRARIRYSYDRPIGAGPFPTERFTVQLGYGCSDPVTTVRIRVHGRPQVNREFPPVNSCTPTDPNDAGRVLMRMFRSGSGNPQNVAMVDAAADYTDYQVVFNIPRSLQALELDWIGCRQGTSEGIHVDTIIDVEITEIDGQPPS